MRKIILSTRIKPVLLIALCTALLILCVSFGMLTSNTRSVSGAEPKAVPEGTDRIEVTYAGGITDTMTYAEMKRQVTVTAYGEGDTELGTLAPDAFELVGDFSAGGDTTSSFKAVVTTPDGEILSSAAFEIEGFTVTDTAVRSISAEYTGTGTLQSGSTIDRNDITVTAIRWDGTSVSSVSNNDFTISGVLTPDIPDTVDTYDKEITVTWSSDSKITCTCLITGISARAPIGLAGTPVDTVRANAEYKSGDIEVGVVYSGFQPYSLDSGAYTVKYMRLSDDGTTWVVEPDAKGYIYENGIGKVLVEYKEAGTLVTAEVDLYVSKVPVDAPYFTDKKSYMYTVDDSGAVTGDPQTITLDGYDNEIMSITNVTYAPYDGQTKYSPSFVPGTGTITVKDAGKYTATIELNEGTDAYYFRDPKDSGNETIRSVKIEFEVTRAPLKDLEVKFIKDGESVTQWNRDDVVEAKLSGNYGNGKVTYKYKNKDTGAKSDTLPNETGTYELTVTVSKTNNFAAGEYKTEGEITIGQRIISAPSITSTLTYNGTLQEPEISYDRNNDKDYLDVTNNGGTNAEYEYSVTFKIKDTNQAKWADDVVASVPDGATRAELNESKDTLTLYYKIGKLSIAVPTFGTDGEEVTTEYQGAPNSGTSQTQFLSGYKPSEGLSIDSPVTVTVTSDVTSGATADSATGKITATNAGTYTITVKLGDTVNLQWADGKIDDLEFIWIIEKATVTVPDAGSKPYTGSALKSDLADTSEYTVTQSDDWTNVGSNYNVTLTLRDKNNYKWSTTNASDDVTVQFTITQAANEFTKQPKIKGWTYSEEANTPDGAEALFGTDTIVYMYSAEEYGEYTKTVPTEAGTYYVKAFIDATDNYAGAESDAVAFTIDKAQLTRPTADSTVFTYNGKPQTYTPDAGFEPGKMTISGNVQTNANETGYTVTVRIANKDNYEWSTEVSGNKQDDITFTFIIKKATLTVTATKTKEAYSGNYFVPEYTLGGWCVEDDANGGYTFSWTVTGDKVTDGEAVNAGTYSGTLEISRTSGTVNYTLINNTVQFEITQAANSFTSQPSISGWTYGEDANKPYGAEAQFGTDTIVYKYSASEYGEYTETVPTEAGTYYVKAFITETSNYTGAESSAVAFTIAKAGIDISTIVSEPENIDGNESLYDRQIPYTGNESSHLLIKNDDLYTIGTVSPSGNGYAVYSVTLTLKYPDNYKWTGLFEQVGGSQVYDELADGGNVIVRYEITKAQFAFSVEIAESWTYGDNSNNSPEVSDNPGNGTVTYTYYYEYNGSDGDYIGSEMPKDVGSYRVYAVIAATDNYASMTAHADFKITPRVITVDVTVNDGIYGSWEKASFETPGYNHGDYDQITADDIKLTYYTDDNELVDGSPRNAGDYTVTADFKEEQTNFTLKVTYNSGSGDGSFTISQLAVELDWGELTHVYDGNEWHPTAEITNIVSGDSVTLTYSGAQTGVGNDYTVYVTAVSNDNYTVIGGSNTSAEFSITPATITVTDVEGYSGTYDGKAHNGRTGGTVSTVDGSAATWHYRLTESEDWQTDQLTFTNAGTYTVRYKVTAANHEDATGEFTVSISKVSLIVIVGNDTVNYGEDAPSTFDVTYNGFVGTDSESDLGGALVFDVNGYSAGSDAGTYTVKASGLTSDNYVITYTDGTLQVVKINATVTITPNGGVYGGTITGATATVDGLIAADEGSVNVVLTYTGTAYDGTQYNGTEVPTKAGAYTVTAALDSTNYTLTGVTTAAFIVERATVTVPDAGSKPFAGSALKSDLADTSEYTVTQGEDWTNAGNYNVTLTLRDKNNYKWSTTNASDDVTVIFAITQAANSFTSQPSITGWTYSEDANKPYGAAALFGTDTIVYMYSAAAGGEYTTTVPAEAGTYYVKAFIAATDNYAGAESDAVEFTIAKYTSNAISGFTFESSWVYNATPTAPSASAAFGTVQYKYAVDDGSTPAEDIAEWSDVMPTAAGSYWICAYVDGTDNYNGDAEYKQFTITPATLTVTGVVAGYTGTYDGNEHNALKDDYPATTVDGSKATWEYRLTESVDGDWQEQLTFKNAGTYKVDYRVTAANHKTVTGSVEVRIDKKAISIAINGTITYGEALPGVDVGINNGTFTTDETDGGYADGENFDNLGIAIASITADGYEPGDNVGDYTLTWTFTTGESSNYTVTADRGTLKVARREITVEIDDINARYNEEIKPLTYSITEGNTYDGEVPFYLSTTATKGSGITTDNNKYYIYPTVTNDNYIVTFTGKYENVTINNVEYAAVGEYIIEPASTSITITPPSLEYNGKEKTHYAGNSDGVELSAEYYTYTGDVEAWETNRNDLSYFESVGNTAPVNVGYYCVVFTSKNPNYEAANAMQSFVVTKKQISVVITAEDSPTYDGLQHEAEISFIDLVAADEAGWEYNTHYILTYKGIEGTTYESADAPKNAGKYTVTVTLTEAGGKNYTLQSIGSSANFEIEKAKLTIKADDKTVTYGNNIDTVTITYQYDGFVNGENADVLGVKPGFTTDYKPGDDAGSKFNITPEDVELDNYDITFTPGTLTVEKRAITVTINDQSLEYTGVAAVVESEEGVDYTISGNGGKYDNDDLIIVLSASGTYVGTYAITGTAGGYDVNNYDITYSGKWEGGAGILTITPKALTIRAKDVNVTYGDDAVLSVDYIGLVEHDILGGTLAFTTANKVGGAPYEKGDSAGSTYTIEPDGLTSDNYDITFETGTLTVQKRVVTVNVKVYGYEYNYGTAVPVDVTFNNVYEYDNGIVEHEVYYKGSANDGSVISDYGTEEPVKAGQYTAKVRITDNNYTFADGKEYKEYSDEYDYTINKRAIDVNWENSVIAYTAGTNEYTNMLKVSSGTGSLSFADEVLTIVSQTVILGDGSISEKASSSNNYTITVSSDISATPVGTYSATIQINASHFYNYMFDEGDATTIVFEISADANILKFVEDANLSEILDWTYGEPGEWTLMKGLDEFLVLTYGNVSDVIFAYAVNTGVGTAETATYTSIRPTDAGEYYVRIYYPGSVSEDYGRTEFIYAEFTINKAVLTAPSLTENESAYIGSEMNNPVIGFDAQTMGISTSVNFTASGNDITLLATTVGTYEVIITLKQPDNHMWTDGTSAGITLSWKVTKALNNEITDFNIPESWTYGDTVTISADAVFGTPVVYYVEYAEGDLPGSTDDLSSLSWSDKLPENTGRYLACAFVRDTNENYNDAWKFAIFKINNAELSVSATGYEGIYDGKSHNAVVSSGVTGVGGVTVTATWKFSDSQNGEYSTGMPIVKNATDGAKTIYYIVSAPNYNDYSGQITVNIEKKDLTIRVEDVSIIYGETTPSTFSLAHAGLVSGDSIPASGLTYKIEKDGVAPSETILPAGVYTVSLNPISALSNYDINYVSGKLNVASKTIAVNIEDQGSVYGEVISLDQSKVSVDTAQLVDGDTVADLGITLSKADGTSAGTYPITGTSASANYVVVFVPGVYTISAKAVSVTITPNGGVYSGTITGATATVEGLIAADEGSVNVVLTYTGTAYDGTQYNGTEVPTKAGAYTVTATLDSANYTLTGVVSATFIVERAAVTVPDAGSKTYTGSALKSDLADTSEYTVTQGEDWTNAGNYNVTLTLKDKNNYKWSTTGASSDVTVIFAITQAANSFTSQPSITGWTYSEDANAPGGAAAQFGTDTIVYKYSASEDGEYTTNAPTAAGTYYVKAFIAATDNYVGAVSDAVAFTIAKYTSNAISGFTFESSWVYNTTPTAPSASAAFGTVQYKYAVDDGSAPESITEWPDVMPTAAGSYWICAYVDGTDNYNGAAEYKQFTITPATITVTGVAGYTGTYDGTAHGARTGGTASTVDGIIATWQYSLTGSGNWQTDQLTFTDAGTYTVHYKVTAANHSDATGEFTVNIYQASLTVIVGNATINYGEDAPETFDVTYNGFVGTDSESDLGGALVFDVDGYSAGSDAGTYTVKASGLTSDNYVITYTDGTLQVVKINATVTITPNGGVYGGTITGATATVDGLIAADEGSVNVVLTYTGTAYDGTTYNGTEVPTKAGAYTVTAALDSTNYTLTGVVSATFIVERATVTVPDAGSKTYTGSALKSDLTDTSEYTVTQGDNWTAAGNYNVTLTLKDKNNYKWSTTGASDDVTVIFAITQAANSFTSQPSITGWTYSEDANKPYGAVAQFGTDTIVYMYSAEEYGEYTTTVPTEAGTYYVKAFIAATDNYAGAESDAVKFTIAKYTNNAISGLTFADSWVYNTTPTAPSASAAFGTVQYKYAVDDGSTPAEDITEWSDVMPTAAGSYWICAYVDGTDNYNGAAEYKQFTITPATITVTGVEGYTGTYDGTAHSGRTGGTASTVDGSAATWQYSLTGSGDWQTDQLTFTDAGTYTVHYKVTAANHSDATGEFTVNIYQASLTVIVGNATINYGEDAPGTFEVTYNGFVGTDSESDLGGAIKFSVKDYVPGAPANSYIVSASGLTSGNYNITYTNGMLRVVTVSASVTITPNGGVYGGTITGATATAEGLIAADEGSVNVVLTYTGTAYDGTQYNGTEVPTKAGAYTVTATLDSTNYTLTGVTTAAFIVERATVTVPDAGSKTYTGSALKSDLTDTSEYTVTQGEDWTNAGNYNVTLTLKDKNNYKWSTTNASDDVTVIFAITQAANSFTSQPAIDGWTYSEDANKPYGAAALFGTDTIVYMYSASEDGEYTTNAPTAAGTYYVKAFIAATNNYAGAVSDAVEFTIAKYTNNAISGFTFESSWVYNTTPTAPSASAAFGTVQYKYAADDGSTLPGNITNWSTSMPTSVGNYWICAYVDGTDNYNGAAEYKQFTITQATLTVTGVAGYNGTYDGTAHSGRTGGIVTTVDGSAATWEYSLTGSGNWQTDQFTFKNAGTYTVYYRVIAANHNAVTGSFNVNINKASLTVIVGNATINYGEDAPGTFDVTYNGFVGTDSESDLGGAIKFSVKDYVPGAPANSYIVSASGLTSYNYDITYRNGILFVTSITITATITPNGGVYGGTIIGATATLNGVPAGADIEPILTYTGTAYDGTIYNSTEVPTKAGSYTVTVSLSDDSYTLSGVTSSIFTIERATVTVPDAGSKTYTGSALKSDLTDTSEYTVAQGEDWTNAGNYNVTLTLRDKNNYKWSTTGAGSDVTVTFTITQAENKFTAQPVIEGWTYSEDANAPGGAEALFGTETIVYMYSAAADGEYTTTVPTEAGTYYVKAFITETSNYTGAESDAVMFEIVIHAGAATPELEFETSVYSGAEQTNEITGYDASIMSMTGTAAVSTSDGITVLKATNAGVYTVTITLKNENYTFSDGSTSVTLSWTISRQSVDKPTQAEGEWIIADGNTFEYIPVGFDDDLMKITGNKITEPGNYTVTVTLRDTNNYVWDDGTDDPVVFSWSVAEKEISLLWLIILLIVVIVIEIILLIAGIVRRRKSDNDGSGDGAGKGNAGFAAAMAFTVMSDVIIPSHLTACCVLGGIAVILLVCVLIVYLKKKKSAEDKQHAKKADLAEANVKAEQNGKDNADKK